MALVRAPLTRARTHLTSPRRKGRHLGRKDTQRRGQHTGIAHGGGNGGCDSLYRSVPDGCQPLRQGASERYQSGTRWRVSVHTPVADSGVEGCACRHKSNLALSNHGREPLSHESTPPPHTHTQTRKGSGAQATRHVQAKDGKEKTRQPTKRWRTWSHEFQREHQAGTAEYLQCTVQCVRHKLRHGRRDRRVER